MTGVTFLVKTGEKGVPIDGVASRKGRGAITSKKSAHGGTKKQTGVAKGVSTRRKKVRGGKKKRYRTLILGPDVGSIKKDCEQKGP